MDADTLAELHAPLLPILRHALALAPLPRAGRALDLACGPGLKAPLLAEALGPGVRLLGVDIDQPALRAATRRHSAVGRRSSVVGIVGDALALPLRDGCCAAGFCIAALGLFADRRAALRELRRVLCPGAPALLVVGSQLWAQVIRWPPEIAAALAAAYGQALGAGAAPLAAAPDLSGDLADLLGDSGFAAPLVRAFLLGQPAARDQLRPAAEQALESELPLLPWPALRGLLSGRLAAGTLARCDRIAAESEIEQCALALAASARAA